MRRATLLRLYPRRWRERYGEEFEALLAAERPTPGLLADVVRGALVAHARSYPPGGPDMNPRSRIQAAGSLVALLAVLPSIVLLAAAVAGALQPEAHEPSRAAHQLVAWAASLPGPAIAALFLVAPVVALAVGVGVLWSRLRADESLRQDLAILGGVLGRLLRRPSVVIAAAAAVGAAGVLLFAIDHLIAG